MGLPTRNRAAHVINGPTLVSPEVWRRVVQRRNGRPLVPGGIPEMRAILAQSNCPVTKCPPAIHSGWMPSYLEGFDFEPGGEATRDPGKSKSSWRNFSFGQRAKGEPMATVEFQSASEMHAHYDAVHRRLTGESPQVEQVQIAPTPKPLLPPVEAPDIPKMPLHQIICEVAAKHGLTPIDLTCESRNKRLVHARFEYYYRAATETNASLVKIGLHCGDRDHTTVLYGLQKYCLMHGLTIPRGGTPCLKIRSKTA